MEETVHAIGWALDISERPDEAAADWLARDIDPSAPSAVALLTHPDTPIEHLRAAKSVFKTLRVVGETAAERRLGARCYALAIAGALAFHDERVSTQSDAAMLRAFDRLLADPDEPEAVRRLAARAIERVRGVPPIGP